MMDNCPRHAKERGGEKHVMASFTRKAIMDSCLRLLEERPVDKITVKDIVEDCGINRNTFYYHFSDLPSLVEAIIREDAEQAILSRMQVGSLLECLQGAGGVDLERVDLRLAMQRLPQDAQTLICLRYFRDHTQAETAQLLHRSQTQISRMERRALDQLHAILTE